MLEKSPVWLDVVGTVTFSADGSKRFFATAAPLVPGDIDGQVDVYQEVNGEFTLVSTGPTGGNGAQDAGIRLVSHDGSHVVFATTESLVAADTDATSDIYVWSNGVTQLVTQDSGPDPAHNSVAVAGASADGSVLYLTASPFQLFAGVSLFRFSGGQLTPLTLTSPSFSNSYGPSTTICATSADGATIYVNTFANIAPSDTDPSAGLGGRKDLYRISGGQATLVSAGLPDLVRRSMRSAKARQLTVPGCFSRPGRHSWRRTLTPPQICTNGTAVRFP